MRRRCLPSTLHATDRLLTNVPAHQPDRMLPTALRRSLSVICAVVLLGLMACGEGNGVNDDSDGKSDRLACDGGDKNRCREVDLTWPAGPEDDIKGVPAATAKYKSCGALWSCGVAACGTKPGSSCLSQCLAIASTNVVTAFLDTTKCAVHTCANKICANPEEPGCIAACMWSRCLGFAVACNAPANVYGNLSCGGALTCLTPCQGNMTCLSDCFAAMDIPAQIAFISY